MFPQLNGLVLRTGDVWAQGDGQAYGLSPGYPRLCHNVVHKLCAYSCGRWNQPARACCWMQLVSSVTWL